MSNSKCLFVSDGCNPLVYRVLDDPRRSVSYQLENSNDHTNWISDQINTDETICDDLLPFGWYRIMDYGMWVQLLKSYILSQVNILIFRPRDMATQCPPATGCGTHSQVWLDLSPYPDPDLSSLLTRSGGNISIDACVSWALNPQANYRYTVS